MKILLTGASGFIGSKVLSLLKEKYGKENVVALTSKQIIDTVCLPSADYCFGEDYFVANGHEDIEVVIHLGAFTPKDSAEADNIDATTSNIQNSKKLLEAILPNLKKFIFISTLDVYANHEGRLTESTQTNPKTLYGWSKLFCEQMISKDLERRSILCDILRLGHIFGEGEEKYRKVIPVMIKNAVEGNDIVIFGDGKAIRTFIYVDDVAEAIENSIEIEKSETINVVGEEAITINELAEMIAGLSDKKVRILHAETNISNIDFEFDNSKMRRLLLSELTPFYAGLKREFDYMKEKLI